MKAFSTIEIMLALFILSSTLVGVSIVMYSIPFALANIDSEHEALEKVRDILAIAFYQISNVPSASTSVNSDNSLFTDSLEDQSYDYLRADASWSSVFGVTHDFSLRSIVRTGSSTPTTCDPFVSGDWTHPVIYPPYVVQPSATSATGKYPVADLTIAHQTIAVAVASTSVPSAPSLLFYTVGSGGTFTYITSFDNATSSRIGFSKLASNDSIVYAGNAFGSASSATCSDTLSCAQVQVFSLPENGVPVRTSTLNLSTSSAPFAINSSGASAAVSALSLDDELLFVGIEKTVRGDEFNIVDAHDPRALRWLSGIPIGRTVRNITIRDGYAYLATDDSSEELVIVNIKDPLHPLIQGKWDAPGAIGFGYGTASTVHDGFVRFGRSYSGNAPEFYVLDSREPSHVAVLGTNDLGTASAPESVRDIITQDFLTFVLTTHTLQFWNTASSTHVFNFASPLSLTKDFPAMTLECDENTIFIGGTRATDGEGFIESIKGS